MRTFTSNIPILSERINSLLHIHSDVPPVFNKPIDTTTCPHHRLSRTLYAISLILLIVLAIPVIVLRAITSSFIEDNRMQGFIFETTEPDGGPGMQLVMAALPRMLYHAPAKIALVAAVVSIFLCAAHLGFVGTDWKTGKRVSDDSNRETVAKR